MHYKHFQWQYMRRKSRRGGRYRGENRKRRKLKPYIPPGNNTSPPVDILRICYHYSMEGEIKTQPKIGSVCNVETEFVCSGSWRVEEDLAFTE